jgi:hypothetical protein
MSAEALNEQAARDALIKQFGTSPPPPKYGESYPEIPPTGYALILSDEHIITDKNGRSTYIGICPKIGWVITRVGKG